MKLFTLSIGLEVEKREWRGVEGDMWKILVGRIVGSIAERFYLFM